MSKLVKQSLVDQIYEELRNSIITQKIGWGERLNVSELQQQYELSSTPIREALNRLQKEGLVEYKTNFGARVIELTEKDIIEIQEVAMALDVAAIKYAIVSGNRQAMLLELDKIIKAYQAATEESTRSRLTEEFADVFYKNAGNERLITLSQAIRGQKSMLKSTYINLKKNPSGMEDHIRIYEAVKEGQVEKAQAAMVDNYEKATALLLQGFHQ
jgi:DNA-binding GntR family transcriptional regulator